ncbi:MAG: hypothetical protein WDO73_34155 [Ignavibacteriota bacterium]
MIYPALLASVGLCSILILLNFVVPRFASIFDGTTMKVPVPAQIMIEASYIVRTYWWMALSVVTVLFAAWRIYTKTAAGRLWWDGLRLRFPLLGDALLKAETSRFCTRHGNADLQHGCRWCNRSISPPPR